jgi:hypothetical protein
MSEQTPETTCDVCGRVDVCRTATTASHGLRRLPQAGQDWLTRTYGQVPAVLCCTCFLPALGGANTAAEMASQV